PLTRETLYAILPALGICFVVLIPMVTALIAGVEEKTLGMAQWHLTLPISAWAQWLIKFLTAFGVAVCLGEILPLSLAWLTVPEALHERAHAVSIMLAWVSVLFVLSFWA